MEQKILSYEDDQTDETPLWYVELAGHFAVEAKDRDEAIKKAREIAVQFPFKLDATFAEMG